MRRRKEQPQEKEDVEGGAYGGRERVKEELKKEVEGEGTTARGGRG